MGSRRKGTSRKATTEDESAEESEGEDHGDSSDGEKDIRDETADTTVSPRTTNTIPPSPRTSPVRFPPCLLDTVVLNPPFGTRQSGIDTTFLHTALQLAHTAVYSLHKTSTRPFFVRLCERWCVCGEVVAAMRFDLKRSYAFHREAVREVEVDLWRFTFVDGCKPQRFCAPHVIQNEHRC